jgi:hypothetical protein
MLSRALRRTGGTVARRMAPAISDASGRARTATAGDSATPALHRRWRGKKVRTAVDLALVAAIGMALTELFLRPTWIHAYAFPVGPDVPVYLWWAKVAASPGVSLVAERPAVPVLLPTLGAALHLGPVPALAGLQYALGPAIGLAAAALLRGRGARLRAAWVTGGLLAGVWATHLGAGYVANLAFVGPYVAAAGALARRTSRGVAAAALLLAGGGLAHPQFFLVGALILLVTAGISALMEGRHAWRSDAGRTVAALLAGGVVVGAGLIVSLVGPPRLSGDTSKDAFLRRTGQWGALRDGYFNRFHQHWRRYAPVVSTPFVIAGALTVGGYARRFLLAWLAITALAVPLGILTGWYPPDRMLTFAFCVPMLVALGLVAFGRWTRRWWIAWPVGIVVFVLVTLPSIRDWDDQQTIVSPDEVADVTLAGRIAATTAPGTALVFVADQPRTSSLFLESHALNVARAAVPPERAADVYVFVGRVGDLLAGRPTRRGDASFDLASRATFDALPSGPRAVFVVRELDQEPDDLADPALARWDVAVASSVPDPRPLPAGVSEVAASSPGAIGSATVRVLALLFVVGFGWAWWAMGDVPGAAAVAPAFGVTTSSLASLAAERVGAALLGTGTGVAVVALAGGGGYALLAYRLMRQRTLRFGAEAAGERQPDLDS